MTDTDLQARLRKFGTHACPFDDTSHHQEQDDPCEVCGGLGTSGAEDKCVGNMALLHEEAADELSRLTEEVERLKDRISYGQWRGKKETPGWCAYCGKHRSAHRDGDIEISDCPQGAALTNYRGDGK